ncbi:unnamed protein product, partial [marine sediment metagenome]
GRRKMAKERLSKLQKWILGKLNNAKTNYGYYCPYRRRDLAKEYEKDFPEELTKLKEVMDKRTGRDWSSQWIHYCWNHQFQVVLTNSLKNLRKKDLITIYDNDDIRLTDKGTMLIESLIINKTHFINVKELE